MLPNGTEMTEVNMVLYAKQVMLWAFCWMLINARCRIQLTGKNKALHLRKNWLSDLGVGVFQQSGDCFL